MSYLRDERGNKSSARLSWWLTLSVSLVLIVIDMFTHWDVPAPGYAFLTTVVMFCGGWCAGPRIMQHIGQIAGVTKAVGDAAVHRHDPGA